MDGKKTYHANQQIAGVAVLISDKSDIRAKKITKDKEEHYIMIPKFSPPRRHSNLKCVCNKQQSFKVHEAKQHS